MRSTEWKRRDDKGDMNPPGGNRHHAMDDQVLLLQIPASAPLQLLHKENEFEHTSLKI